MLRRALLSLCLISTVASTSMAGQAKPDTVPPVVQTAASEVDALIEKHLGAGFNGVVLVQESAASAPVIVARGQADFEKNRLMQADTLFQIGSISKWISAVAALRLVDQGKLTLDIPIGTYLPELPPSMGKAITLRHLLSNTAGIPNGVQQAFKKDKTIAELRLSHLEATLRFASAPPMFAPGAGWEYSPTGWIVVAALIERVAGTSYAVAVERLVLGPAQTTSTAVPQTPFGEMATAALAYKASQPRELNMTPHITFIAASGTLYSTAADLAKLAHAVYETPLLSEASRAELSRIVVQTENYALGGRIKMMDLGGRKRMVAWQTGATGASKSVLAYVPGEGKTVVILNNTDLPQGELGTAAQALLQRLYN